jgi:hypothetical protein
MSVDLAPSIKSRLVGQAEDILDKVKTDGAFKGQTSQLRNMLQIVQTESEFLVLRNFIRYQTGRKATRKFWLLIHDGVLAVLAQIDAELSDEKARRAALQSFFGYLVRHYVYLSESQRSPSAGGAGTGHGAAAGVRNGAHSAPAGAAPSSRRARG